MFKILLVLIFVPLLFGVDFKLIDSQSKLPVPHAIIHTQDLTLKSDENGSFSLKAPHSWIIVKAYGYRPLKKQTPLPSKIELEKIDVKALYLSFWGASPHSKTFQNAIELVKHKEINALVIDVKNEYGSTSYKTSFDQANSYGAWHQRTIKDIEAFMKIMKEHNIYTIARIVTFKDELQATNNPSYAIKKQDGSIWRNHDNMAWVDPFDKRSHEYVLAIAEDAAQVGFDEINFDYIRFPAKEGLKFRKESTQQSRLEAIETFLQRAQKRLQKYPVFISVDTYGNICWSKDDNNIGQTVSSLAKYSHYLAPMLYPSGFASGSFGFTHPSEYPHAVLYRSIKNIHDRIEPVRIRPWLQYFKDYAHKKRGYRKLELHEQIRACNETNTSGWMVWSPSSKYINAHFAR